MKTCVGFFVVAFVACLCALVGSTSTASAGTCTFNSTTVVADGQAQPANVSGCTETASNPGLIGSSAFGFLSFSDGVVRGSVTATGDATISLAGQVVFPLTVTIPAFTFTNSSNTGIKIGNLFFDVSSIDLRTFGTLQASVTNQSQALGAFINVAGPGGLSLFCGSADTDCGGINTHWISTANITPNFALPRTLTISIVMSERLQLSTGGNLTNTASIDASDPFDITSFELLDANGVPIPGVTFTADDGTIFPDAADTAATPVPAALPLFATGIGGLGLLGWRRKRKAQAVA